MVDGSKFAAYTVNPGLKFTYHDSPSVGHSRCTATLKITSIVRIACANHVHGECQLKFSLHCIRAYQQAKFNTGLDKQNCKRKIVKNIFLPISLNRLYGCSKEPSRRDGSF